MILQPLGLGGTNYPSSPILKPPTPTGYEIDVESFATTALPLASPTALVGSGAMASTLPDLLVWGEALGGCCSTRRSRPVEA